MSLGGQKLKGCNAFRATALDAPPIGLEPITLRLLDGNGFTIPQLELVKMYKTKRQSDTLKKSFSIGVSGDGDLHSVQLINEYLTWFSTGQPSHGTLKVRSTHLAALAAKHPNLMAVTSEDLQRHLNNPDWAQQTKKSHRSTLRSFYGWAYRYEYIAKDPSADLRPIKIPVGRPRPAPEANVEAAIANASASDQVMVLLAAYAGLRRNEIATLRQSNVEGSRLRDRKSVV